MAEAPVSEPPIPRERPTAVTVIGVVSIIVGAIFALGGLWALVAASLPNLGGGNAAAMKMPVPMTIVQLLIAAVMLWASVKLLQLREVGRKTLETLNWLGVVWVLGTTLWTMSKMPDLAQAAAEQQAAINPNAPPASTLGMIMMVTTMAVAVVQLVVIALLLWKLRSQDVREAMAA